jgi:putative NIF3 family GTP cyclohydrolase 1 type 2
VRGVSGTLQQVLLRATAMAGCESIPEDSAVHVDGTDIGRVLFGIDVDLGELLYAREAGFDAVVAHHPIGGSARTGLPQVVWRQVPQMVAEGIEEEVARAAVGQRISGMERSLHTANVNRVVDTARLLGLPLANIHLPCDIISRQTVVELLEKGATPASSVDEVIGLLRTLPEIAAAPAAPQAWLGRGANQLGRWTVAMAGGTNGGHPVFREYYNAGVDTILAMHIGEADLLRLEAEVPAGKNLIITGHMGTDSLGINTVIAAMESEFGMEVTRTSGIVPPA